MARRFVLFTRTVLYSSLLSVAHSTGMVIVGSVDGNRLWGKELKMSLCQVEWAPDGRTLLFGTLEGEVQIFDQSGAFVVCVCFSWRRLTD